MSLRLSLFHRRECMVPTWRGWLLLLTLGLAVCAGAVLGVYPFLAVEDPKPGGMLVVEGWSSEEAMGEVVDEWKRQHYDGLFVTGGPIEKNSPLAGYKTFAEYGASVLAHLGCDPKVIHAISTPKVVKDRTYSEAVGLKGWLKANGVAATTVNLYSMGAHSRRSRLLFQKAFGSEAQIGIVASAEQEFDPKHWWQSSVGFRSVTSEAIAYLYARLLFHPAEE